MPISNSTDRFNGVIASLAIKVRCVVAAEVDVPLLSGISNPYSGINVADLDRILLVAQTDATENGVWDIHDDGLWTRAFDWDGNRDVELGSTIWAGQSGGLDKLWQVQTAGVILPGSTAVTITILFDPTASAVGQTNPIILPEIAGAGPDVPGEGQIWVRDDGPNVLMFTDDAGTDFVVSMDTGDMQTPWLSTIDGDGFDLIDIGVIFMRAQAAAEADVANQGQFWVRNTLDGEPMFTDDQGVDTVLNTGGGGGGTPAGSNEEIQYNDNGAFGASPRLRWDVSESSLDIDVRDAGVRDGAIDISRIQEGAIGLKIQSINGNTTFHEIWRSVDSGGEASWKLVDDHTGSKRLLFWEDDFADVYLEFESNGSSFIRLGGQEGSEKMFIDLDNEIVSIRNGATLYFEEVASANPEVLTEGQVWVRSDTPNTLMFTDDAGTDFVVGGALAAATTFVMVTPVSIALGGDDAWATISDAALAAAGATHALIKCFCQVAPTASAFATQVIHLRETGSAIAKANSNRACMAGEEDAAALGIGTDTNDAWVKLDGSQDFDILQDPTGTATVIAEAWIVGYMA